MPEKLLIHQAAEEFPVLDVEFAKLIPELTCDELDQFKQHKIGFSGSAIAGNDDVHVIDIIPSTVLGFWHVSYTDLKLGIEEYSTKPMTLNGIVMIIIKSKNLTNISLTPYFRDVPLERFNYVSKKTPQMTTNVYIIQAVIGGPVKIGKAQDVDSRIQHHQTGCPFQLKVVRLFENVTLTLEGELHRKYKKYRLHGEWFSEEILQLIDGEEENL